MQLTRITIYPLKSFDPVEVNEVVVLPSGALQGDRQFAFVDETGKFVNAKRFATIHKLQIVVSLAEREALCAVRNTAEVQKFQLDQDRVQFEAWASEHLGIRVSLVEETAQGFPDDTESPGPTIVTTQSLAKVGEWFGGWPISEVRQRFRANLEFAAASPFAEDFLYSSKDLPSPVFRIGDQGVMFTGINPCQRCAVPSRNPFTGEVTPGFAKQFSDHRAATLPTSVARDRFDHFYRLTVNTRLSTLGTGRIKVGDSLQLIGQ